MTKLYCMECNEYLGSLGGTSCSCGWEEALERKEWQGLTDEEIDQGQKESWVTKQAWESAVWWAEAKLKEKNT